MVAVGIVLLMLGWLMMAVLGYPHPKILNKWDWWGGGIWVVGFVLVVVGIIRFAWEYLP